MDLDQRACAAGMEDALSRSGLSQRAFATALGTSASRFSTYRSGRVAPSARFFLRATRIARALERVRAAGLSDAPAVSAAVAGALASGDDMWAFKMLLQGRDHLRLILGDAVMAGAWEAAPDTTGERRWDQLLAAVTAHEFEVAGHTAPDWTGGRPLAEPWVLDSPRLTPGLVRSRTPGWLAERNIFVAANDLVTQ